MTGIDQNPTSDVVTHDWIDGNSEQVAIDKLKDQGYSVIGSELNPLDCKVPHSRARKVYYCEDVHALKEERECPTLTVARDIADERMKKCKDIAANLIQKMSDQPMIPLGNFLFQENHEESLDFREYISTSPHMKSGNRIAWQKGHEDS